jgi:hypothetical protein
MDVSKSRFFARSGFLAVATAALTSATADAAVYSLSIPDVRPGQGATCESLALSESERLAAFVQTHLGKTITLKGSSCADESVGGFRRWKIRISYDSDVALPLVATGKSTSQELPVYATAAQCEAAVDHERTKFESNTGLAAFRSYCRVPAYRNAGWNLEVMGFGTPQLFPRNISTEVFGTLVNLTSASFFQMITSQFTQDGMDVAHIVSLNRFPYHGLAIRYYGSQDVRLSEREILAAENPHTCVAQVERVRQDLQTHGFKNFGTYCSQHLLDRGRFAVTTLLPLESSLKVTVPSGLFQDLPGCEAQLESTIRDYRDDLLRDIATGYCSPDFDRGGYKITLLERV